MTQDHTAIFGPKHPSDYAVTEPIAFYEDGEKRRGTVIQCCPAMELPGGLWLPVHYWVDCGDGFPHVVPVSDVKGEER